MYSKDSVKGIRILVNRFALGMAIFFLANQIYPETSQGKTPEPVKDAKEIKEKKLVLEKKEVKKDKEISLSLEKALQLVIDNNLTIRSAKYDIIMSDSAYQKFLKKFSPSVNLDSSYLNSKIPPTGLTEMFGGNQNYQLNLGASLSKVLDTGTTLSFGLKEIFSDSNDKALDLGPLGRKEEDPAYHQPIIFFSIRQELLKNAFGYQDKINEKIHKNTTEIKRLFIVNQLSYLVVDALADYWRLSIFKSNVANTQDEMEYTRYVRNLIARNVRYGLTEDYDLNQYNALLTVAEIKLKMAEQSLLEAKRKLLRTINVPAETKITGVTDLAKELPELDAEKALQIAYAKRVDILNAQRELKNLKYERDNSKNNLLPSLTLNANVNSKGQDKSLGTAVGDAPQFKYPDFQVGVQLSYPLDDTEAKANMRDAEIRIRQSKLKIESLKQEIRDEIFNAVERVKMQRSILDQQATVRRESELFYSRVLKRSNQGKLSTVVVKNALDGLISARQKEMEALVLYNITVLQLDLAQNRVFERYKIDVQAIINKILAKSK